MKYTVCRYEHLVDGEIRHSTAVLPGFVAPRNPDLQKFFTRTRPEHGVRDWKVRLHDFTDEYPSFRETYAYWARCSDCGLAASAHKRVFYRGPLDAEIVFVGEAPGQTEDKMGIPFVGRSGLLLDLFIESTGFSPKQVLIANPVLCRPVGPSGKDRKPTPTEIAACVKHLRQLLDIVRPRWVVLMGVTARDTFGASDQEWESYFSLGIPTRFALIYHPAWYLRNGGREVKEYAKTYALLSFLRMRLEADRKRVRPVSDWGRVLWPCVERAIKHCKADTVFKGDG